MTGLRARGLDDVVKEAVKRDVPLLGICVGMQALFEIGEEMVLVRQASQGAHGAQHGQLLTQRLRERGDGLGRSRQVGIQRLPDLLGAIARLAQGRTGADLVPV